MSRVGVDGTYSLACIVSLVWMHVEPPADDQRIRVGFETESERIELGDDLFIYADTRVRVVGWTHDVEIKVVVIDGRLSAGTVQVSWRDSIAGARAVTSDALRDVPVARLVSHAGAALHHVRGHLDSGGLRVGPAWPDDEEGAYVAEHGLTDETLRIVARIYRVAYLVANPPTKSVESTLNVPRSTAGRWIAAARERGFLGPAQGPGRAGGVTPSD
jgi:hypothetical protein